MRGWDDTYTENHICQIGHDESLIRLYAQNITIIIPVADFCADAPIDKGNPRKITRSKVFLFMGLL